MNRVWKKKSGWICNLNHWNVRISLMRDSKLIFFLSLVLTILITQASKVETGVEESQVKLYIISKFMLTSLERNKKVH